MALDCDDIMRFTLAIDRDTLAFDAGEVAEAMQIMRDTLGPVVGEEVKPGKGVTGEALVAWVEGNLTYNNHYFGGIPMDSPQKPGVLDNNMQFMGIKGLYVADSQAWPRVPLQNPICILIANAMKFSHENIWAN